MRLLRLTFVYQKINSQHSQDDYLLPKLAIMGAHANHDTQACFWVQCCVIFGFDIFIMIIMLSLYQTKGLFKICAPVTDQTKFTKIKELISRSQKITMAVFTSSIDATLIDE